MSMVTEQMAGQAGGAASGSARVPDFPSYHVPHNSWRPIAASVSLFLMMLGAGTTLNQLSAGEPTSARWLLMGGFGLLVVVLYGWFATAISEHLAGVNSARLKTSYVYAMCWFIFTEVMFFAAFFGALFYLRVLAVPWLGGEGDKGISNILWQGFEASWPLMETPQQAVGGAGSQLVANNGVFEGPYRHMSFPGWGNLLHWLPLWNTMLLLSSSFTVHIAHLGLKAGNRLQLAVWLGIHSGAGGGLPLPAVLGVPRGLCRIWADPELRRLRHHLLHADRFPRLSCIYGGDNAADHVVSRPAGRALPSRGSFRL